MQLLAKCIEEFGKRHLKLAKDLEEQMVTGSHRDPELLRKVLKDILIEKSAKLRLILLGLVFGWIEAPSDEYERIFRTAEIPMAFKDHIWELSEKIRKKLESWETKASSYGPLQMKKTQNFENFLSVVLQRYTKDLDVNALICLAHGEVKLATQDASSPSQAKAQPLANSRGVVPTWHIVRTQHTAEKPKRVFVVVVGGITCTEMRIGYEEAIRYGIDIILVSDKIINPSSYTTNLMQAKEPSESASKETASKETGKYSRTKSITAQ